MDGLSSGRLKMDRSSRRKLTRFQGCVPILGFCGAVGLCLQGRATGIPFTTFRQRALTPIAMPSTSHSDAGFIGYRNDAVRVELLARPASPWDKVGGVFSAFTAGDELQVPGTTEDVVKYLQNSMVGIVEKKVPRATIDIPAGLQIGIDNEDGKFGPLESLGEDVEASVTVRSDRELAAAFVLMFDKLKASQQLCLVFRTPKQADRAKSLWKAWGSSKILSMKPPKKQGFSSGISDKNVDEGTQFVNAIRRAQEDGCKYLVAVGPRRSDLEALAKLDVELTNEESDLGIILLNSRIRGREQTDEFIKELSEQYNPAFNLRVREDALVYKAFSQPWVVAKRADTVAKEVWRGDDEPEPDDVEEALLKEP